MIFLEITVKFYPTDLFSDQRPGPLRAAGRHGGAWVIFQRDRFAYAGRPRFWGLWSGASVASIALQEITAGIAFPAAGNPAQYVWEKAYARAGLDWRYLTLEVPPGHLEAAARGMLALGFRGFHCSNPHKSTVVPLLGQLTPAAAAIGAVNCVYRQGDQWIGDNTEGKGCLRALRALDDLAGKKIVVFGDGRAARAVAVELALMPPAEIGPQVITIVSRHEEHGTQLVEQLHALGQSSAHWNAWHGDFEIPVDVEIAIHATPLGSHDSQTRVPINISSIRADMIVADLVYDSVDTRLLREARERHARTVDGLAMLVEQTLLDFQLWTGVDTDQDLIADSLEEFLSV